MASKDTSGKAAAAAAAAADDYDPRRFQNPHPDDRDGGGAGKSKANTNAKTKTKTTETKASKDTTGKAAADGSHCCYHCGTADAKLRCGGCRRAWYCGKACQKKHWKHHKAACQAAVAAVQRRAAWRAAAATARRAVNGGSGGGGGGGGGGGSGGRDSNEACVICVGPVRSPVELPCRHAYCGACLAELRAREVAQTCPLCRADLPEGLEGLWDLAYRAFMRIYGMVERGEVAWASLPAAEREEMEEVVAMLTEAAAQGHMVAQAYLGDIFGAGWGVAQDDGRAFELCRQAAQQGDAVSQYNVGAMYREGEGCEQSYERAAEWWAKAAEQGYAGAQLNLGIAHQEGAGVPQSYERAVELYKLGEAQGNSMATNNLGRCYETGWGVDQSYAEARRLYEMAVVRGDSAVAPRNIQATNANIQQVCPLLGQRVVLRGLNTAALNGTRGTAVDFGFSESNPETGNWFTASGRYTVRLDGPEGRLVKVRAANVEEEEEDWTGGGATGVEGGGGKKKGAGKNGRGRK